MSEVEADKLDSAASTDTKKGSLIYYVDKALAGAFKEDCDMLLAEFKISNSLKFTAFSAAWRTCSFTHIFAGQEYLMVMKDFIENCYFIIKQYLTSPTLHAQVGALYILYGLYYKQPMKNWIQIRLTSAEYKHIISLIEQLNELKEYDAAYIFAKMKSEDCFQYVAHSKALGPEDRFVKNFESNPEEVFSVRRVDELFYRFQSIEELDTVNKLAEMDKLYKNTLAKYAGQPLFDSDIVEDIKDICGNIMNLPETSKNPDDNDENGTTEHF